MLADDQLASGNGVLNTIDQGLRLLRPPEFFGVLAAMQGGGSVVGGLTAAAVIRRHRETPTIALALWLFGIGLFAAAVQNVVVVLAALGVVGLAVSWFIVAFVTLRQRLTPSRLQGRVQAAANMALTGPQTIGTAVGAALVTLFDYRVLIVAMGAVALACIPPIALVGDADPPSADPA